MYDAPNAVEELKRSRKHSTAEKVDVIKDALQNFSIILSTNKDYCDIIQTTGDTIQSET